MSTITIPEVIKVQDQNVEGNSNSTGSLTRPLTANQELQLSAMGLRADDFECFVSEFVGHRFDYITRRPPDGSWRRIKAYPLSNAMLLRHLSGECWLGTGCRWDPELGPRGRHATPYVVVDIDFHGDWSALLVQAFQAAQEDVSWADMMRRYEAVVRALGHPSVVFRSSDSGGLHCYYLFTDPVELHTLRAPDGLVGALPRLLAANGVPETAGQVEVYPRGQYKRRGPQNRVRLPFGRGSVALDPHTLDRLSLRGPLADLRAVTDHLRRGTLPLVEPEYWIEEARHVPATSKGTKRLPVRPRKSRSGPATTGSELPELRRGGLTGAGQFNRAVWLLGIQERHQGASCEEAVARVCAWLDEKHNGCSRTYNGSRDRAQREVRRVMGGLYALPGGAGQWGELPGLSHWEASGLICATSHDHQLADPTTGELLPRYKVQLFGFELLRRSKQWLLREVQRRLAEIAREDIVQPGDAIIPLVQSFWPDCSLPEFIVPVPYKLRARIKGVGKDSAWALWRVMSGTGLFRLSRRASADAHRAAAFVVSLDFGTQSAQPVELDSLPQALNHVLTAEEIRTQYSQHYARSIRASSGPRIIMRRPDDLALATIQQLLRRHIVVTALPEAA